jgi:hypothetical protein
MISEIWDTALEPQKVAATVTDAIREQRFYVLTHPGESHDMLEQQIRWMKTNVPLAPGPGVARIVDPAS